MTDPVGFPIPGAIPPFGPLGGGVAQPAPESGGADFKSMLLGSLDQVARLQNEAERSVQDLAAGRTENVAEVFAAVNKAGVAFDLLMEIRNKLLEAYREIQQMRV